MHELEGTKPAYSKRDGNRTKQVWYDAAGQKVMEINTIAGMGHGTPVGDGLGRPGPYMLDVGISSTREIAEFWAIAETSDKPAEARPMRPTPSTERPRTYSPATGTSDGAYRPRQDQQATGVKKAIEDALRAAGLMR